MVWGGLRGRAPLPEGVDTWLGPDFLEAVLRRALREPRLAVTRGHVYREDEDAGPATPGEHKAEVRRARVEWAAPGRAGEAALLVKAEPAGEGGRLLRRLRFFAKERAVYGLALPDMARLHQRHLASGARAPPPLAPDYFPCDRTDALVIGDLRAVGFRTAEAPRGLNLEHCTVALRALALFHAGSVALRLHRPDALLDFRESFFTADNAASLAGSVEPALAALAAAVAAWPGYERFAPKIDALRARAISRLVEVMKPDGARPLVLNHGDFWTGSLLFRYEGRSGAVTEARMLNFQLARWGSPALDLQFFLYTSPSEVVRAQCFERLLELYHLALASALAALKCFSEVPSLEQLRAEMAEKADVGLLTALSVLGGIMTDPHAESGDELQDPRYRKALQRMLPIFEERGLL